ncbi:ubiquinol-cytochrome c reductase iron-sulfur subunit [Haladaptatus sp. YSMS36]|uniref:ubiquinol-cytochrome c reductase iron-sulfur subunit n=1 Tax=Haladaptatus sp. YSMS36 TaxID=3033384 RepID=UPI0023E8423C|nr:ubiquinol-cytochrome c reductase iron-sulfur subunit [Haladaptatus sp. YSMS36]
MPVDDDKYPTESGRRRFVKGVVGSATLASVGTGGVAALNSATAPTGAGGGIIQYLGIENTDGPAPRGMPQIPIEIDSEGFIKGVWPKPETRTVQGREITVAEMELGGETYSSEWFQYCGAQSLPGIQPAADQDNFFRSTGSPPYEWQSSTYSGGDKIHIDDFQDYESWGNGIGASGLGKPAMGTWRSEGVSPQEQIPIQVLRSKRILDKVESGEGEFAEWLRASTAEGFIAWLDKCTHFCCVPAFKAFGDSSKFGAEDRVYCQCHQSVYDPFSTIKKSFVALPRPDN